ncbi:MAG: hypothetical protein SV062_06295 [Thermodesulfobacteriota bacterium]|nr:hypothetical protein [Thermodesulfobacteriota bacterium]
MIKRLFFFPMLSLFFYNTPSFAGILKMEINTKVSLEGDILKAGINVKNKGNEPAYSANITVIIGEKKLKSDIKKELGVNETFSAHLKTPLRVKLPGRYPLIVYVYFYDANQYRFSALSYNTYFYNEDVNSAVFAKGENITLGEQGKLKLKIFNRDEKDKDITLRLILPGELSAGEGEKKLPIKGRSKYDTSFSVTNLSALEDAKYPVFTILEYEENGRHFTSITPGKIKIVKKEEENIFKKYGVILAGLGIILLIIFIFLQLVKQFKEIS